MKHLHLNESLQWAGTAAILVMYVLMSFYPELRPWNIVAGLVGSGFFFTWAYRVGNKQQMLVNAVGAVVCLTGLYNALGT